MSDYDLDPKDLEICGWSSKKTGGFSLSVPNGVAILHKPSGIFVTHDSERSQHKNRHIALTELKNLVEQWNTRAPQIGWVDIWDKLPEYGKPLFIRKDGVVQREIYCLDGSDDSPDWLEPSSDLIDTETKHECSFFITHDIDVKYSYANPPEVK